MTYYEIKCIFGTGMEVEFADQRLERLESDARYDAAFSQPVVKAFRRRMQLIRAAVDERDFRALRSLRFEKLQGKRAHQYSMRLNDQWRLIIEILVKDSTKTILIIGIEDYH